MLTMTREAAELPELLLLLEVAVVVAAAPPPNPVYTTPSEAVDAAVPTTVDVAGIVVIVLVLTLVGFWAPHGCC